MVKRENWLQEKQFPGSLGECLMRKAGNTVGLKEHQGWRRTGYEVHRSHSMGTQEAGTQDGTCWSSGNIDLMCLNHGRQSLQCSIKSQKTGCGAMLSEQ